MKRVNSFVTGALLAFLIAVPGYAQQPGTTKDATPTTGTAAAPADTGPGSMGSQMPMMDMCRHMMGDMMAMPMMGGHASADPKEKAEMLQMRGEMMKAMGDIMMKHARRMQGAPGK